MVQTASENKPQEAFRSALARILPTGWRIAWQSEPVAKDLRGDVYLVLTSPSGDRIEACVEFKSRAEPAEVVRLVPWLQGCRPSILVAPVVGARTREILSQASISWFEPDGDCRMSLGSLFIERLTKDRPRRPKGSPDTRYVADLFSGGPLRVVRWLLIEPERPWTLDDLAAKTSLSLGFVSRILKTLARDAYLDRARGDNRVRDRDALLDAWASARRPADTVFERVATTVKAERLLEILRTTSVPSLYAVTAEAAADRLAPFALYSRVEMYTDDVKAWDRVLGLTEVPRGGNLVLIKPADLGVFDGLFEREGLRLVSRPQLVVDLMRRGGAAAEAAAFLRERGKLWKR